MYDYLIVGCGLAGICFAETAIQNKKSVFVIDKGASSSEVAAGVYNAVILKRFTLTYDAQQQINLVKEFYPKMEQKILSRFIYDVKTYRKLTSIEEQNNFIVASDRPLFQEFLSSEILFNKIEGIDAPYGYGQMLQTGYVDTSELISRYKKYLQDNNAFSEQIFDYSELEILEDQVVYKGVKAKKIVFCEGFAARSNPYFSDLPIDGVKGELLLIKAKKLKLDVMIKSDIFVLPVGDNLYKVGATYNWEDKTSTPTQEGKSELVEALKNTINCDFEIVEHLAGIRPTVKDRKPLIGKHKTHNNVFVLNGLGTRGVMLAPYLSQKLFDFIELNIPLSADISVDRVYNKLNTKNAN